MLRGTKTQFTRRRRYLAMAVTAAIPAVLAPAAANAQPREAGIWYDDSGKGAVEVIPCGDRLCGRIVWLKEPLNDQGQPKMDRHNPNPARQTTPICGLQVIGGLQKMPEGTWDSGWIYDPKTGSAYDAAIQLVRPDQLQVTGYKGVKLFSKSFTWMRAPDDLPRCDGKPAAGQAAAPAPPKPANAKPAGTQKAATPPAAGQAAAPKPAATQQKAATTGTSSAQKPAAAQKAQSPAAAQQKPATVQKPAKPSTATAGETLPWAKE